MKKLLITISTTGLLFGLSACSNSQASDNDEVIAETKAGNISSDDLYIAMKEKYGEQALQELLYKKVLEDKYKVEKEELDKKVKEIKDQAGSNFEALLMQNNIKDEKELKEILKEQLLIEKAAIKDIKVTDKELKESYENYKAEIKARHILVEDEKTAKDIKNKLDKGEKFEDLAKQFSKDPGSAENGGDLGWFGSGKMVPEFEEAAYALEVNKFSDPVKTQNGYHIIQVTDKKEKESFESMKNELEYQIKVSKIDNTKIEKVMNKEFEDAKVKINDKDLKGILATSSDSK
ncbi:peptidylprolyl isomerase [Cytobacillus firmus]|uniref:peptidylprolyl isomerase n=1 Tax=Cytobacillus firmus TaxID=1399 RepID=UPI002E1C89ED|nr:peptidylprolyl isomerase [Cytobacillus firmus]